MPINITANTILYIGALILISGIIALTVLQSMLIGRLRKSIYTFFSAMFYPDHKLSNVEQRIKKIGNFLTILGSLVVLISGFFVWVNH
jgi:hypothetical protein